VTEQLAIPALRSNDLAEVPFGAQRPTWALDEEASDYVIKLASVKSELSVEQQTSVGLMARFGITSTGDWLNSSHSCSLHITTNGPGAWSLWQALWRSIKSADVWLTPAQQPPIKLLICDMDSTLIPTESLDELAAHVGIGEQVARITSQAMNGELDFVEALNQRVGLLKGLDYTVVEDCVAQTEFNRGALELIQHARNSGVTTVLVSGGFTAFAEHVGRALGCERVVANELEVSNGALTGKVLEPIVTKDTKLTVLKQLCEELGILPEQCCTIGDGANDIPMLQAAGTGIAYRAKTVVLAATPFHLTHAPLNALKPMLSWS